MKWRDTRLPFSDEMWIWAWAFALIFVLIGIDAILPRRRDWLVAVIGFGTAALIIHGLWPRP